MRKFVNVFQKTYSQPEKTAIVNRKINYIYRKKILLLGKLRLGTHVFYSPHWNHSMGLLDFQMKAH